MENQIALVISIFFIIFSFIGILRKPLTVLVFFFVFNDILNVFIPSFNNIACLIICAILSLLIGVLLFKFRFIYGFIYGFIITYLTFFHLVTAVDAVILLMKTESNILINILQNNYFLPSSLLKLFASVLLGLVIAIFNKKGMEFYSSIIASFIFMLFLIDIFRGGVSEEIIFNNFFSNILSNINLFIEKSKDIYINTQSSGNYLNMLLAIPVSVVVAILTTYIKRKKYDFL